MWCGLGVSFWARVCAVVCGVDVSCSGLVVAVMTVVVCGLWLSVVGTATDVVCLHAVSITVMRSRAIMSVC